MAHKEVRWQSEESPKQKEKNQSVRVGVEAGHHVGRQVTILHLTSFHGLC